MSVNQKASVKEAPCFYCGMNEGVTKDHITPLRLGGSSRSTNLVMACLRCNQMKKDMSIDKFLEQIRAIANREEWIRGSVNAVRASTFTRAFFGEAKP